MSVGDVATDWQFFERIVAAIHLAETKGAKVTWNERINQRQFDVVVRFKQGFYEYVTLIECKNLQRPVPVKEVEAFIIKSRDAGANKSVLISPAGFQSGCMEVAKRHKIDLLKLSKTIQIPDDLLTLEKYPTVGILSVQLVFDDPNKNRLVLPDENGRLEYLVTHSTVTSGLQSDSIRNIIWAHIQGRFPDYPPGDTQGAINTPGAVVKVPEFCEPPRPLMSIQFTVRIGSSRVLRDPSWDQGLVNRLHTIYELRDMINNRVASIEALGLRLGIDTVLETGKFYCNPLLGKNYYCERVVAGQARMWLLESYASGHLVQVNFLQSIRYQEHYVEINDVNETCRLQKMLQRVKEKTGATFPDPKNPGCKVGWGVYKMKPWHFVGLFGTRSEAEAELKRRGSGYSVAFGANREGTDDFIAD